MNEKKYFLPYQIRWLNDDSPIKVWEKSRRIGATYVQAYEDVRDCLIKKIDVWFSSADESAAREYIIYVEKWTRFFHTAAQYLGLTVIDSEKDIKAYVIEIGGNRINALSSSPRRFRSKEGKVVLDEFAHHDNQEAMWSAAEPITTWGYPIRMLSTHNGQSCLFYQFINDIKKGVLDWKLYTTPIHVAIDEGLLDKIMKRPTTKEEQLAWIEEKRKRCRSESRFLQEYCCIPVDETIAFLTYEMISRCERDGLLMPLSEIKGELYVGMDIARKKHLSIIWGIERLGHSYQTRILTVMEKAPFRHQRDTLFEVLKHPTMRRACIDATGLGMQLAEEAQERFGKYRVEAVTFTSAVKEELASNLLPYFEDVAILIPNDFNVREDLHSVRKIITSAGNVRFDVDKTDEEGHADRFWALALALHAASSSKNTGQINVASRRREYANAIIKGF